MISNFDRRTGCPVVVNTSFNVRGEPIVCTPHDAFTCFARTRLDALVIGPFVVRRREQEEEERRLMYVAMTRARDHLAVTYPLNSYGSRIGSDYFVAQLSRFVDAGVRGKMERVALSTPATETAPEIQLPTIDLRALLRGRFGS
ncbi:MAG: carbamoyltransferase C-terminal domain-containing protein [Gemmatimonadaceae bacterium]